MGDLLNWKRKFKKEVESKVTYPRVKIDELTLKDVARICDHTFLDRSEGFKARAEPGKNPIALRRQAFVKFLDEVVTLPNKPYAVCVRPEDVNFAKNYLHLGHRNEAADITIASVVGFPDGSWYSTEHKLIETKLALQDYATEIDFVLNYDMLKTGDLGYVRQENRDIVGLAERYGAKTKMILEVSELNLEQVRLACLLAEEAGVDFVKTSTGYSASGATVEALGVMRQNFPRGIKISGGVKTLDDAKKFLRAAYGVIEGSGAEVDLDPENIRIGESGLLKKVEGSY
jgi:deoxyribose-phosphate aldolase